MVAAEEPSDPRVERTRMRLRRSLLELLAEEDYASITLQNVVERAQVARSTFYNHYDDQDQLLADCFAELSRQGASTPRARGEALDFVPPLLDQVLEAHVLFETLLSGDAPTELERRFEGEVAAALRRDLGPACHEGEPEIRMMAAAFVGLVRWWLGEAPHLPPAAIEKRYRKLASWALFPS